MDLEHDGNIAEAGLWFFLGVVLFLYSFRQERHLRSTLFSLAATLVIFGGSDLVEARTGGWWTPWWLFVWKALCVVSLFFCFRRYYRLTKKDKPES